MIKRFAALAILSVVILSAKSFSFKIPVAAMAGKAQLQPGEYRVNVEGSQATLTGKDGQRIDTTVKVGTAKEEFKQTAVSISEKDGQKRIDAIRLKGTNSTVVFE